MANKIFISMYNPYKLSFGFLKNGYNDDIQCPLTEDINLDISSEFDTMGDMIPGSISGIIDLMRNVGRGVAGVASAQLETILDLPVWKKTNAVRINPKLLFYVQDDPLNDVWAPAMGIVANSILQVGIGGTYKTPGISLATFGQIQGKKSVSPAEGSESQFTADRMNVVTVEIPGVIFLEKAVITSAKPTFSKQITESGYPLWAELDVEIRSIYPANDMMFKDVAWGSNFLAFRMQAKAAKAAASVL
jgi:hypothetical protein